ncbi:MAG TPA: ATP-binding protein [Conexibacter sp.]|jgi:signal transduction histidine kinase
MSRRVPSDERSRWRWTTGLRARLALTFSLILVVALGTAFIATYRGTATQVRNQIDDDLRNDAAVVDSHLPPVYTKPRAIAQEASDYLDSRLNFGNPAASLFIVRPRGTGAISNLPELNAAEGDTSVDRDVLGPRRESPEARALGSARLGFSTVDANGEPYRLYFVNVIRDSRKVAEIGVGEPASAINRAQSGVARTFLFAGTMTLIAAILLGFAFATRLSQPLRRMARTATEVTAGDLSQRIDSHGPQDEVRVLADAFDGMLDRLEDAFARQRGFVADASHELRTPLTVIRGQLEVLARQSAVDPQDVRHVNEVVRTEVLRMERLVEDLLLLARADEGELVRPAELDLSAFVTELFDALTLTADRNFELSDLPAGRLIADEDRIAQVVRNLARNAVEHTGPGGVVRLTVKPVGRTRVELAIEDDGPGIPVDQRDRVFDRFHRTDSARARRTGGAGLGLAIARAIVEGHGGRIYAESSPEGGARVAFTLPGFRAAGRKAGREPAART